MNRTLILVGVLASTVFVALAPCAAASKLGNVDAVHDNDGKSQTGAADPQPVPFDFLKKPLAIGFGSQASANACLPLGHSCNRQNNQCCPGSMCGYRNTCCDRPLRGEICASNAECCGSNFCYHNRCQ